VALITCFLVAVSPVQTQLAYTYNGYPVTLLLILLSSYFFINLLDKQNVYRYLLLFFTNFIGVNFNYFFIPLIITQTIYSFFMVQNNRVSIKKFMLLNVILCLPVLFQYIFILIKSGFHSIFSVSYYEYEGGLISIGKIINYLQDFHYYYLILLIFFLSGLWIFLKEVQTKRMHLYAMLAFFINLSSLLIILFFSPCDNMPWHPLTRYLFEISIFFNIIVAYFICNLLSKINYNFILKSLFICSSIALIFLCNLRGQVNNIIIAQQNYTSGGEGLNTLFQSIYSTFGTSYIILFDSPESVNPVINSRTSLSAFDFHISKLKARADLRQVFGDFESVFKLHNFAFEYDNHIILAGDDIMDPNCAMHYNNSFSETESCHNKMIQEIISFLLNSKQNFIYIQKSASDKSGWLANDLILNNTVKLRDFEEYAVYMHSGNGDKVKNSGKI
jgi:hypothetical protein